ncbi:Hemerythrin superfamily protein [Sphingomonas antarctica]|uniref:hemerythrin domain-containing protein n=1 Tax=Sphingomonas antarctica TaxID=2040274 RepID=UPI0039E9CD79
MSLLDKVAAAVAPVASDETRAKAHADARTLSRGNDWLGQVLDHHEEIDALFERTKAATDVADRQAALKELGVLLTGHSIAEEAVLYPALVKADYEGKATIAYTQQSTAKTEMFLLEGLDPTSEEWTDKLEHIIGAVRQHVYQEESSWFVALVQSPDVDQALLTEKYAEQFDRYMGGDKPAMFN